MPAGSRGGCIERSIDKQSPSSHTYPAYPLTRLPAYQLTRLPAYRLYVLTFANRTSAANRNTTLGNHAATTGLITPPAPIALVI